MAKPLPEDQEELPIAVLPTLDSQHIKLPKIHDKSVRLICDHDNLGIIIRCFPDRDRVYLKEIIPRIYFSKIKGWGNKFRGRYIFQIQNNPVVTLSDAEDSIAISPSLINIIKVLILLFLLIQTKQIQPKTI